MHHTDTFLQYLTYEKRCSPHTVTAYEGDIKQFFDFLGSDELSILASVRPKQIRNWVIDMSNNGLSPRSIHRKVSSLKTFYKHLQIQELVDNNPAVLVTLPKIPKKLPTFVQEKDMDFLLDQVDFGQDYEGVRNKLILELFYGTGMRLSELVGLRHRDVDLSAGLVKVLGKRNKQRLIPLTNEAILLFKRYNVVKQATFGDDSPSWIFLTSGGNPVYHKLVYRIVNASLHLATTMQKKSPHVLRHTFATVLLNRGADINAIKELLGHSNLNATQIYTHNTFKQLNAIYKQAHPRA